MTPEEGVELIHRILLGWLGSLAAVIWVQLVLGVVAAIATVAAAWYALDAARLAGQRPK